MTPRPNCNIGEVAPGWVPKAMDTITSLVINETCSHAGLKHLMAKEATLYGLFDACCQRCPSGDCKQKLGRNRLCLFINRLHSSSSTTLMRVLLEVESTPCEHLRFCGGKDKDGSSWRRLDVVVIHPIYEKAFPRYADRVALVEVDWPLETIDAGLSVHAKVRAGSRGAIQVSMDIPVTLVPVEMQDPTETVKEIMEVEHVGLTEVVLATSLKILMEDSWRWLKSQIAEGSELISLNIGAVELTPSNTEMITNIATEVAPRISSSVRDDLYGYNRKLDNLKNQKRRLLEEQERASTAIDRARTLSETDFVEREMDEIREKIYTLLKSSLGLHLTSK